MAEELPKMDTAADILQAATPLESNVLPAHAVQAEALQKDIVMSDAPTDQPAVRPCSSSSSHVGSFGVLESV